jgi:hypothetical protein
LRFPPDVANDFWQRPDPIDLHALEARDGLAQSRRSLDEVIQDHLQVKG